MQFIDPRSDYAFKRIFGNDKAHDVLISFLNAVMSLEGEKGIKSVMILNPYEAPKVKELKHSFLDVKCMDHQGVRYIVEMQVEYVKGFIKRVVYNTSKTYVNQIEKGIDYPKLDQVISLNILDFIMFEDKKIGYLSHHLVKEKVTNQSYIEEISYYFIELPKFMKSENELEGDLEKWVFFIKNAAGLAYIPKSLEVEVFKKAFDIANRSNMSQEEWELYDQSLVLIQDQKGAVEAAFEKGEEIGIKKGEALGIKKGEALGIKKGEKLGRLETAGKLLKMGIDLKTIKDTTGISEEDLS